MAKGATKQAPEKLVSGKVTKQKGTVTEEQRKAAAALLNQYRAENPGSIRQKFGNTVMRLKSSVDAVAQLPKQARLILDVLDKSKSKTMTVTELVAELQKIKDKVGVDFTRQEPSRIFQFYRGRLMEGKHIECK